MNRSSRVELRLVVVHRVREEAAGGFGADELAKVDRARVGGDGDEELRELDFVEVLLAVLYEAEDLNEFEVQLVWRG